MLQLRKRLEFRLLLPVAVVTILGIALVGFSSFWMTRNSLSQAGKTIRIGTIADTVEEVVEIAPEQIAPAPKIGTKLDTDFIEGLGRIHESFVVILDTDKIFTTEEIAQIAEPAAE